MHPTFAIVSPTGDVVELGTSADSDSPFILDNTTTGMGFAAREVQVAPSTGDGGRFRASRVASRPATLVVAVWGRSVEERTANLARLAAAVRCLRGYPLPRLEATMPDGTVFELPFVHEGGGDDLKRVVLAGPQVVPFDVMSHGVPAALSTFLGTNAGSVSVDSGHVIIVDPCHLPDELRDTLTSPSAHGVTVGVIVETPGGDGDFASLDGPDGILIAA